MIMDYEKLYKDTIIKLQQMVNSKKITVETACNICADFVPESNDEEIRKFLINEVMGHIGILDIEGDRIVNNVKNNLWKKSLIWLEKQGEHANFRNNIQIGDKVTRNEDGVLVNISQLNRVAKKDEKLGEQKPACEDDCTTTNEWSKKDNDMMKAIIEDIHMGADFNAEVMREANERELWLKSLKCRYISLKNRCAWKPSGK